MSDDKDHSAELIHQTIPECVETEPRLSIHLRHWYVVTPEYGDVIPILDDGTGPMEYQSDVIEVEAASKRDAITMGVKQMLADYRYKWCRDARLDGVSPFAGVKAYCYDDIPEEGTQVGSRGNPPLSEASGSTQSAAPKEPDMNQIRRG